VGDIRKMADSDHGLLAGDRHCDRRQEQSKQVEEGLHLLFRGVAVLLACAVPPVIGGDPCQRDSNRTSESVSMLGAVRDRVPGVEQFAASGNLHGKSSELVDFILYAGVPPEQQISRCPGGTIDRLFMLLKPHRRSRTERFNRPYGTGLVSHNLPALRTGLLSNVPAGRDLAMATVNFLSSAR